MARRQTAAYPPGDLYVGLVGRDREPAVLELRGYACAARRFEVAELVRERRLQRLCLERKADGGVAATVRPDLAVIRDVVHRAQGGGRGVRNGPEPSYVGLRGVLPIRLGKR